MASRTGRRCGWRGWWSVLAVAALSGCRPEPPGGEVAEGTLRVVATTNIVGDLVEVIGAGGVTVETLMGAGVDPHLYQASAGDVETMAAAQVVVYNGLHLEGKLAELLEAMDRRGIPTHAVAGTLDESQLLTPPEFAPYHDPHAWFDVALWSGAVEPLRDFLTAQAPQHGALFAANAEAYLKDLAALHGWVAEQVQRVPEPQRVLVTAHDAFGYFGRRYGFEVRGLQGISTEAEAGAADVRELAQFIADRKLRAIFVESSVSPKAIEAVRAAVRERGFEVVIGGQLYSDALGDSDTAAGTYLGMVRANVETIVSALLGEEVPS